MATVHLFYTVDNKRCTVTSQQYSLILKQSVILAFKARPCDKTAVFMQDGTPPHIPRCVKQLLRHHFGDERIISLQFPIALPPRSPDLNPYDFWLLGIPQVHGLP